MKIVDLRTARSSLAGLPLFGDLDLVARARGHALVTVARADNHAITSDNE
jgi:hypothetical protein